MLKLWGRRSSINVQKVLWTLAELGLPFEQIDAGVASGLDTAEFRARNPHGRIPVIDDDGAIIWESNAIVRYLAARYSVGALWPQSPAERGVADQWMDWCATGLPFMDFFWSWYRTPESQRDAVRIAALLAATHRALVTLDAALDGRSFLAGDHLTIGDIPAGTVLYRYFTLEIARPHLPRLEAWYRTLCERPAYRDGVMLPYDELRGRLAF